MTHALKTWPEYFQSIVSGEKNFELREDDRPYEVGDTVILQEYRPKEKEYSGKELAMQIAYILRDAPKFGLKPGFVILGLKDKP